MLSIASPTTPQPSNMARRPRSNSSMVNPAPVTTDSRSQEWFQERLEGVTPEDFTQKPIAMCSVCDLVPPSGFSNVWKSIHLHQGTESLMSIEDRNSLQQVCALIVLADIADATQRRDVKRLVCFIHDVSQSQERPRIILLQHSVRPSLRPAIDETSRLRALSDLSQYLDDSIIDEKKCFLLAWDFQNRLLQGDVLLKDCNNYFNAEQEMVQLERDMKCQIDDLYWDYLRVRLNTNLPPVDPNIAPEPSEIDGDQIGPVLGSGSHGDVLMLTKDGESVGRVLKKISKKRMTSIHGVNQIGREIDLMQLISSPPWAHPHIVKLCNVYHSETHVLYSMVDAGPRSLVARLRLRDRKRSPLNFLTPHKAKAICAQTISAICHLHNGPRIVHCDIKPENIILRETADDVHIMIADFDQAILQPTIPLQGNFGTIPFVAPEIQLRRSCNPYSADVWSTGIVFLEVLCRVNVLEIGLGLRYSPRGAPRHAVKAREKQMASVIHQFFSQEGSTSKLLETHLHPQLRGLMPPFLPVLSGMLNVMIDRRADAAAVAWALREQPETEGTA